MNCQHAIRFGKELNIQLRLHQRELYYHEKNNSILYLTDGRGQDNAELEATKTALVQERERHAKEQMEREERYAQERAEMRAEIEQLKRLMQEKNLATNPSSEETAPQDQERAGTNPSFFARR